MPLILNPAAGRGRTLDAIPILQEAASRSGFSFDVRPTTGRSEAQTLAAAAAAEGAAVVAVGGGDGTISEAAAGLLGTASALAVIPLGTGNDLARHLRLPLDSAAAAEGLVCSVPLRIDAGRANGRAFLLAVGTGFDAAVARAVNEGQGLPAGALAYPAAVAKTLWNYAPARMRIEVDGAIEERGAYLVAVGNGAVYGGGMKIAPGASVRDGLLDVCCIGSMPRGVLLAAAGSIYCGKHVLHPAVSMRRGRVIRIDSTPAVPVVVDGEEYGETPVSIEVLPAALTLAAPALLRLPV